MARLADPSSGRGEYSLQKLSQTYENDIVKAKERMIELLLNDPEMSEQSKQNLKYYKENFTRINKFNMKQLFGYYKLIKTGNVGKVLIFPELIEMHTNPTYVKDWIEYACFDAEITYFLRETLRLKLAKLK